MADELSEIQELVAGLEGFEAPSLIGRGAMGIVFRSGLRAVKVLSGRLALDPQFEKRFRQEAGLLARLDHPNILRVYQTGVVADFPYFVMEYVEGTTLRRLMRSTRLEPARALGILEQVVQAVAAAHAGGVIHRDIKPENILVGGGDFVRVADFGISQLVERDAERLTTTLAPIAAATPVYMAPELLDDPQRVDAAADVYSLGVLAYELLTGSLPLGAFAPPSRRAAVDDRLDGWVMAALEPDPQRRVASAGTWLETLRQILRSDAPRVPLRLRARRLLQSRLFLVLLVGGLAEAVGLGFTLGVEGEPDPERSFEHLHRHGWYQRRPVPTKANTDTEELKRTWRQLKEHKAIVDFHLGQLGDPRVSDRVDRILAREGAAADAGRADLAVNVAYALGKEDLIPPMQRTRVLLDAVADWPYPTLKLATPHPWARNPAGRWGVHVEAIKAMDQVGPSVAPYLLERLASGSADARPRRMIAEGLGRWAGPTEVRELLHMLKDHEDREVRKLSGYILVGRLSLPQSAGLANDVEDVPYAESLHDLIDAESAEALWMPTVTMALELERRAEAERVFAPGWGEWLDAWAGRDRNSDAGVGAGSPGDHVARILGDVRWPLDEDSAARLERDILLRSDTKHPLLRVLLLHWYRTGRYTIPYYRFPSITQSSLDMADLPRLRHAWDLNAARAMVGRRPDPETVPWECFMVHHPILKREPTLVEVTKGRGRVEISRRYGIRHASYVDRLRFGLGVSGVMKPEIELSYLSLQDSIRLGFSHEWKGHVYWSGMGNRQGSMSSAASPGEPYEMICLLGDHVSYASWPQLPESRGTRYGTFAALVVDPYPFESADVRWRRAVAAAVREAAEQVRFLGSGSAACWIPSYCPIPEAESALRKVWSRRAEFEEHYADGVRAAGAGLLLLGDSQPMKDEPEIWKSFPDYVTLRLSLFSPDETIRRTAEPHVLVHPWSRAELEQISEVLLAQGRTGSTLGAGIEQALSGSRRREREALWEKVRLPFALVAWALLACAWVPFRGSLRAVAIGVVMTGLLPRLITLGGPDRVWLPQVGDLIVGVGMLLYGGWFLRIAGLGVAAMGAISIVRPEMVPATTLLFCLTFGVFSTDLLAHHLPRRVGWTVGLAYALTWGVLLVPAAVGALLAVTTEADAASLSATYEGWPVSALLAPFWLLGWARLTPPAPPFGVRTAP